MLMTGATTPSAAQLDESRRTQALIERNFAAREGQLLLGGQTVQTLAEQFGTPLFVYDASVLQRQWQTLRDALPDRFRIFYSIKANPNLALLRFFLQRDCGLEIASAPCFERYTSEFNPQTGSGKVEIWIPLES